MHFMSTEVASHEYQYQKNAEVKQVQVKQVPAANSEWFMQPLNPKRPSKLAARKAPGNHSTVFRHDVLHDAESVFWLGSYVLLKCVFARRDGTKLAVHPDDDAYQKAQNNLLNSSQSLTLVSRSCISTTSSSTAVLVSTLVWRPP